MSRKSQNRISTRRIIINYNMIKKNSNNLKKLTLLFAISLLALNIAAYPALAVEAISSTSNIERGRQTMGQMMGANYDSMDEFMDQMMGENGTQSMYELMGKINTSGLSASDTKPLSDFMTACQSQSANNYNVGGMMGNWNWNNMMGAGLGVGGLFLVLGGIVMVIFWVIVIMAGVALLHWLANYLKGDTGASGKAMEILKEKYAKSEISKAEFETKKKDLA